MNAAFIKPASTQVADSILLNTVWQSNWNPWSVCRTVFCYPKAQITLEHYLAMILDTGKDSGLWETSWPPKLLLHFHLHVQARTINLFCQPDPIEQAILFYIYIYIFQSLPPILTPTTRKQYWPICAPCSYSASSGPCYICRLPLGTTLHVGLKLK